MAAILQLLIKFLHRSSSALALLTIIGCSVIQTSSNSAPVTDTLGENPTPEETRAPSAPLTLSAENTGPVKLQPVTLIEGLEHPWSMAWLPDGSMLITERPGRLRRVRNGALEPAPIAGVPEVLAVSQGGLMDVSLHPRFSENRLVYLTYSHGTPEANRTRVVRGTLQDSALENLEVIFEVTQAKSGGQHFGSRMIWLSDETLLISIGDGGNPPLELDGDLIRKQAQNLRSRLGKIVRLRDDGSIPPDNPFVKSAGSSGEVDPAIWSYGHRNIQGLTFDPQTGRVWATEHGSRGGDELNWIQPQENYGWPLVTHSKEYSGGEISSEQSRPGLVDPRVVWTPAIAPSGLAIYRGDRIPQWQGDLFAGGLVSQDVRRIDLDEVGNVVNQETIEIGQRVRDVRQGPDGWLYILTDEPEGRLIRLEPEAE
ncbi:MAG: PQQ-dependent sugar dehydrogenase [Oscillatoriales cyanobacterium RM2_1_1]|nr:PQQ-dependent sugar dehydrogenase [Oscillatoriales cyanobacterium SM2_3_0]NJO45232.1 PQQ-dependent sugar dehydrogenase [Oscillatoriales cyanobacterium RM2_1_1]